MAGPNPTDNWDIELLRFSVRWLPLGDRKVVFASPFNLHPPMILSPGQGTIYCAILGSGIGGSGDPGRKLEELGEREREREC